MPTAYSTSQARLQLCEHLDALGEQVCYYDTDSVICLHKEELYRVPCGDYLGEMTNELVEYGPESYILEFVSDGPKNYAYQVFSTKTNGIVEVCKIKGLTFNIKTSEKLNFEKLKEMVQNVVKLSLEIEEKRFKRTKDINIVTVRERKLFKVRGPKRRYERNHYTMSYGHKREKWQYSCYI